MRVSGVVDDVRRLGPHDHVCWGFEDVASFRSQALSFLLDGLEQGQRVWYVGPADDGVHAALPEAARAAVEVVPFGTRYPVGAVVDPEVQVRAYAAATDAAVAAGFTGLRVATDATPLVGTDAQLDAFARYEHLVDRYMTGRPFSAMCAYNRARLGDGAVAELATMHAVSGPETTPFRLHASSEPGCAAVIAGELDLFGAHLLELALDRADLRPVDGELVLDARNLTFVDHTRLVGLIDHARGRGATLVLRTAQRVPRRLVEVLRLDGVRIEAAS